MIADITRFEVIDHRAEGDGRILVYQFDMQAVIVTQDEGRTLKVFLNDQSCQSAHRTDQAEASPKDGW